MHSPLSLSLALLSACMLTAVLHAIALIVFPRIGLLDFPHRYGYCRPRIPYPTGILCVFVFLALYVVLFFSDGNVMKEWGVVAAVCLLGIVSFIDDRITLPFWQRLICQLIAFLIVFATGTQIYTVTHPLGGFIKLDSWLIHTPLFGSLPVMSGIFTIVWLGLTTNAMNWFDGIPGQVNALSVVGFMLLGFLALERTHQPEIALLCFMLCGIALGALVFDFPPARVLMGDSGSMFFGFMLGLIGVYHGGKVATAFVVLAIPLFDAVFVTLRRLMRGASPFKGGRDHLHHRLLERGWKERSVVLLTTIVSASFGAIALLLNTAGKAIEIFVLLLLMLLLQRYASHSSVTSDTQ